MFAAVRKTRRLSCPGSALLAETWNAGDNSFFALSSVACVHRTVIRTSQAWCLAWVHDAEITVAQIKVARSITITSASRCSNCLFACASSFHVTKGDIGLLDLAWQSCSVFVTPWRGIYIFEREMIGSLFGTWSFEWIKTFFEKLYQAKRKLWISEKFFGVGFLH